MRVRLKRRKYVEIKGSMTICEPGSIIAIGKMVGQAWVEEGSAVLIPHGRDHALMGPKEILVRRAFAQPSDLLLAARRWWFGNEEGNFLLVGRPVTRIEMHRHGGPHLEFNDCSVCQHAEWISRLDQQNRWEEHACSTAELCRIYCRRQGDDNWTHFHQAFWHAAFVDQELLTAPRLLMMQPIKGYNFIWSHHCDQSVHIWMRQWAQECQFDVVELGGKVQPEKYDFALVVCCPQGARIDPPKGLPVVMYGHDLWKRKEDRQAMIRRWKPRYFWTPYPAMWEERYDLCGAEVIFRPVPSSMFFTRPNLDPSRKFVDLLVIGALSSQLYKPRKELSKQLQLLGGQWKVTRHHPGGARRAKHGGGVRGDKYPYANAWSEFLGRARFVAFGRLNQDPQPVFYKYYEVLGSGAVPIMPDAPDLARLGVKAWEHFIPVSEIEGNNKRMRDLLQNYEEHLPIAQRAVAWFRDNADRLLWDNVADVVRLATDGIYERRKW